MIWINSNSKTLLKFKKTATLLLVVVTLIGSLRYSQLISQGVKNGLVMCVSTLIPSLFVFMILSAYLVNSKFFNILSTAIDKLCKAFNVSGVNATVLILSVIGGYPVGAVCIKGLFENRVLCKSQAQRLSLVAVCSGPGFVLSYIGSALFNNHTVGIILLASQIIAVIIVSAICFLTIKSEKSEVIFPLEKNSNLVDAVNSACKSTTIMCAMVLLFSAVLNICNCALQNNVLACDIVHILLEVTSACNRLYNKCPLYITSFAIGFGGLCVHFQIFSILRDIEINKPLFFLFRIIQGITSAVATYILLILIEPTVEVFSTHTDFVVSNSSTIWGSIALILTAICFLNSIKFSNQKER